MLDPLACITLIVTAVVNPLNDRQFIYKARLRALVQGTAQLAVFEPMYRLSPIEVHGVSATLFAIIHREAEKRNTSSFVCIFFYYLTETVEFFHIRQAKGK